MPDALDIDIAQVAREVQLPAASVSATIALLDDGNTVPFITRYRRDQTGGLDEEQIAHVREVAGRLRQLAERKATILRSIESQNRLTDELRQEITRADNVKQLEDLYLPYRPKKESLASKARDQGLGPLAQEILEDAPAAANLEARAANFVNADKQLPDVPHVLLGAGYILAEVFNERADLRHAVRKVYRKTGRLLSAKIEENEKKNSAYRDYLDYRERISRTPPHRILAINRGEKCKVLRVKIEADSGAIEKLAHEMVVSPDHRHAEFLRGCVRDALSRLLLPSLEREVRRELTEKAELHAVKVFAKNLRNLLLQPPLPGRRVLALDPGFKAGCKLAALDETGGLLDHAIVHLIGSDERKAEARSKIAELIRTHQLKVVAIGNGTACRQTEELVAEILGSECADQGVEYAVVNEAGASVYSTSEVGREELPDCDPMQRSAISIGRRLQDPLSELVKIDPASIGVGLYQHDAKARHLRETLDEVVQSCVSYVGVDLNSASAALLRYVSGMNQLTARRVYEHRQEHGPFRSRTQLLEVSGLGQATYIQAAGFLKIDGGDNPLDTTWIHPEEYPATQRLMEKLEVSAGALTEPSQADEAGKRAAALDAGVLSAELEIGKFALQQIVAALSRPGRDPREDLPPPIFRRDVVKFEQLQIGMELRGTILNVVDFGAFVDVGLSDSGLVHISQLSQDYIRNPHDLVSVGDQVRVWVASIDKERRRVALTMIQPGTERPAEQKPAGGGRHARGGSKARSRPQREGANAKANGTQSNRSGESTTRGGDKRGRRNRQGGRRPERAPATGPYEKRAKAAKVPITKKMEEGKEAMRTFADLLQYHEKKKTGETTNDADT